MNSQLKSNSTRKRRQQVSSERPGAFPLASRGELGYLPEQVDEFLERARATYDGSSNTSEPITAAEIRQTAFALKKRGYAVRFVDAAMDRLEEVFFERERRARMQDIGEEAWWAEVGQLLREVRGRLDLAPGKRFKRRGFLATGYNRSQVDAFLDRVRAMFAGTETLTTSDVRGVVFHPQWRGYDEDQVDELLDSVIEILLSTR